MKLTIDRMSGRRIIIVQNLNQLPPNAKIHSVIPVHSFHHNYSPRRIQRKPSPKVVVSRVSSPPVNIDESVIANNVGNVRRKSRDSLISAKSDRSNLSEASYKSKELTPYYPYPNRKSFEKAMVWDEELGKVDSATLDKSKQRNQKQEDAAKKLRIAKTIMYSSAVIIGLIITYFLVKYNK